MLIKSSTEVNGNEILPVKIFISYSHKDETIKIKLEEHFSTLKREGFIETWSDRQINPGDKWRNNIDSNLEEAEIILLLISSSFISSDYCYDIEMKRALERNQSREAILIPIIVRPVFWKTLPLAELQALPKDAKPITLWENEDEAFLNITESLRKAIAKLNNNSITHKDNECWQWILQIECQESKISEIGKKMLFDLQNLSEDLSIKLVTWTKEKKNLVFEGPKEAFHIIDSLYKTNKLEPILGYPIKKFYQSHGATIQASSKIFNEKDIQLKEDILDFDKLLYRSREHIPIHLKGLFVPNNSLFDLEFTIDSGHDDSEQVLYTKESKKLVDYFLSCLAVKSEDFWVNLSEYESNRMIPDVLEGSQVGRDMLYQDCLLKQLTASLLHPDTELGNKYWKEVLYRAKKLFGTTNVPINSFYKVWIQPSSATIFETDLPSDKKYKDLDILKSIKNKIGRYVYITESSMEVKCEEDYFAIMANSKHKNFSISNNLEIEKKGLHNFTIPIFKEIILPEIEEEVNKGSNFRLMQQIFHTLILAKWFKKEFSSRNDFDSIVNRGEAYKAQPTFKECELITKFQSRESDDVKSHHLINDNVFFNNYNIRENKEFHAIYSKLFRKGLFKIFRNEVDLDTLKIYTRLYLSGEIDFRQIDIIKTSD